MSKSVKRFKPGANHAYLGHFKKQKHLRAGHNLSIYDPTKMQFVEPPGNIRKPKAPTDPGILAPYSPKGPDTIDLGAPTTPEPVKQASRLGRLYEAGAPEQVIRSTARQDIRSTRQTARRAVRNLIQQGSMEDAIIARAQRRAAIAGIKSERQRVLDLEGASDESPGRRRRRGRE